MSTISDLIGKIIKTPHRLILGREQKIIPSNWIGTIKQARDNGVGQIILTVAWAETGDVDRVLLDQVEVIQ